MAVAGTEIASAYISLLVSMEGTKKRIEGELGKVDTEGVGKDLGDGLGTGISSRTAAIAGAVGGIVSTIATQAISGLSALVSEAVTASDATDKFKKTLSFAGLDTSAIEKVSKQSRKYADDTVYDLGTIQNTTAQLAANGVANYSDLTEAAGNLNAIAGGNQDTFSSVAMVLTQTAGAGKLTTENWNQLANAIPGASGVLIKALEKSGAFTGNFRDAMAKGEITADEFNAALMKVGQDPIAVEAAKSTDTLEGSMGNLSATIVGGLSDAITGLKPVLTGFINGMAGFVGFIKDNIDWIGPLAAGIGIVVGAVGLWTVAQWLLNAALTANPLGLIIVAVGLLIGAIILLVQNWDSVVAWLSDVWGGFVDWFVGILGTVGDWWRSVWQGISDFVTGLWGGIVNFITDYVMALRLVIFTVVTAISDWWNAVWQGISSFFAGVWETILGIVRNVGSVFGTVFKTIGDIVSGIFGTIVSTVKGAVNFIIDAINGIIGAINSVAGPLGKAIGLNIHIGKIPRLANGAMIGASRGGSIVNVGEGRYDEAVMPLGGPQLDRLRDALAPDDGPRIQVVMQNDDPNVLLSMFEQRFGQRLRFNK